MRKWPLFCLAIAPLTAAAADPGFVAAYQLRNASLDATRIAVAEKLVLKKGGAQFEFNHGAFYALEPALGQVAGAVFVGEGVFSFSTSGRAGTKTPRPCDERPASLGGALPGGGSALHPLHLRGSLLGCEV